MTGIHSSEGIKGQGLIICYTSIAQTRIDVYGICSWNKKSTASLKWLKRGIFSDMNFLTC